MKPRLTLIAALDRNRLLANAGGIPWHLPSDVRHFRAYTAGKWLLLGNRTYLEMLGWFAPDHTPLVLSSACGWDPEIGRLVSSVPHALAMAELSLQEELVCCGGAQTYAAALPFADRLVLTLIDHAYAADPGAVYFPAWRENEWREIASHALEPPEGAGPSARVAIFDRVDPA